jgi:hypothetical protein
MTVNNNIYLFQLAGVYLLSGNPEHVVLGDNVPVTLTCIVDDDFKLVTWTKDGNRIANIKEDCQYSSIPDYTYNYTCDLAIKRYHLIIPPDAITDGIHNSVWQCNPVIGSGSNKWSLTVSGT